MKKLFALTMLIAVSQPLAYAVLDRDAIDEAIEVADLRATKKWLRHAGVLDPKIKKQLIEQAEDIFAAREARVSLLRSPWDLTKLVGGSALGLICGGLAIKCLVPKAGRSMSSSSLSLPRGRRYVQESDEYSQFGDYPSSDSSNEGSKVLSFAIGAGCSAGLLYVAAKGFKCSSARAHADEARKVLEEIKKAPVAGE